MIKYLFLFILSLNTLNGFANTSQNSSTAIFGGAINQTYSSVTVPVANVGNILQFTASYVGGSGGNHAGFYKWGANAGTQYQVTSGKTLYITGIFLWCSTVSGSVVVGYGDTALSSNGTVSDPTNPIFFGISGGISFAAGAASTWNYFPLTGQIPASKYPFVQNYGAFNCISVIQGVEQ